LSAEEVASLPPQIRAQFEARRQPAARVDRSGQACRPASMPYSGVGGCTWYEGDEDISPCRTGVNPRTGAKTCGLGNKARMKALGAGMGKGGGIAAALKQRKAGLEITGRKSYPASFMVPTGDSAAIRRARGAAMAQIGSAATAAKIATTREGLREQAKIDRDEEKKVAKIAKAAKKKIDDAERKRVKADAEAVKKFQREQREAAAMLNKQLKLEKSRNFKKRKDAAQRERERKAKMNCQFDGQRCRLGDGAMDRRCTRGKDGKGCKRLPDYESRGIYMG
jgi:hypothetical protein